MNVLVAVDRSPYIMLVLYTPPLPLGYDHIVSTLEKSSLSVF